MLVAVDNWACAVATCCWAACTSVMAVMHACRSDPGVVGAVVDVVTAEPDVPMPLHTVVAASSAVCAARSAWSTAAWASTTA